MGFNTAVMILNDRFEDIRREPQRFVDEMLSGSCKWGVDRGEQQHGVDFYPGQSVVVPSQHADVVQVIAVGGNCLTVLGNIYGSGCHSENEDQLRLLKLLADDRGYRLVKKPEPKK